MTDDLAREEAERRYGEIGLRQVPRATRQADFVAGAAWQAAQPVVAPEALDESDLDALPTMSVIFDRDGYVWQKRPYHGRDSDERWLSPGRSLPLTSDLMFVRERDPFTLAPRRSQPAPVVVSAEQAWAEGFRAGHDAGVLDEDRPVNPYRG